MKHVRIGQTLPIRDMSARLSCKNIYFSPASSSVIGTSASIFSLSET